MGGAEGGDGGADLEVGLVLWTAFYFVLSGGWGESCFFVLLESSELVVEARVLKKWWRFDAQACNGNAEACVELCAVTKNRSQISPLHVSSSISSTRLLHSDNPSRSNAEKEMKPKNP